jgi:hypothetical protein
VSKSEKMQQTTLNNLVKLPQLQRECWRQEREKEREKEGRLTLLPWWRVGLLCM